MSEIHPEAENCHTDPDRGRFYPELLAPPRKRGPQLLSRANSTDLVIRLSRGAGSGPTALAAFDAALVEAGLQGLNLVRLSSVIPAAATVTEVKPGEQIVGDHGDLAFCVYAEATTSTPGEAVWAGVAWALRDDGSGAGLFVEHSGSTRAQVEHDLSATLAAMSRGRRENFDLSGCVMSSARCVDDPVTAVVVATYRTVGWDWSAPVASFGGAS